jgi:uncharacterized protein YihD (DUF1040 family)
MRDVNRIDGVLRELGWHWKRFPDLRLGQLLHDAAGPDIFNIEDEALMEKVRAFHEKWQAPDPDQYDGG